MADNDSPERLDALRSYAILDTPREDEFEEIAALAASICDAPMAAVSLVDEHRQWFKAEVGLGVRETPIDQSVCACVMHEPGPLQIQDLRTHTRFRDNPLVTGAPKLRFYAGAPLRTMDGIVLGMLCVLDTRPRDLSPHQLNAVGVLARQVVAQMEARRQAALATRRAMELEEALREREAAQAELARSEQEHRFVVDHALAGLVVHASDGSLLFANALACEFLGLTREQIAGKSPADPAWRFLRADGSIMPLEEFPVVRVLRERLPLRDLVVGVVRHAGAPPVWGLVQAHPQLDAQGQLQRVVVSFADITGLKRLEEQLKLADRRKDEFLATLAHELRNPLAPIRNAAEALRSGRASAAQTAWFQEVISRQASHMTLMLDDLLEISRISRGKLQLRREQVALEEIVEAACEVAGPLIERKRHTLETRLPAAKPVLYVDKVRLSQVLGNLLTNAAKYTDPGGHIKLSAQLDGQGLGLSVEDSGIGLTEQELARVFEMFGQAPGSAQRSEGGLGIGLALARAIVELHGGAISGESAGPGKGARFQVQLPPQAVLWQGPPAAAGPQPLPASTRTRRILVADDNVDACETLAFILRSEGHVVEVRHRGDEALRQLCDSAYDVAFIDIAMPGLDGYQVASGVRECRPTAPPLLVALTGWDQPEARQRSAASGFDRHLTKPVDLPSVFELLAGLPDEAGLAPAVV